MNADQSIPINLIDTSDHHVPGVVVAGVPLPPGYLHDENDAVVLTGDKQHHLPAELAATSRWPDGSIRWCLLKVLLSNEPEMMWLEKAAGHRQADVVRILGEESIDVLDGELCYRFARHSLFPTISDADSTIVDGKADLLLTGEDGRLMSLDFDSPELIASDRLSATVAVRGCLSDTPGQALNILLRYDIFAARDMVLTCEIHNPDRALHPEGIWDLGDAGSVLFSALSLAVERFAGSTAHVQFERGGPWYEQPTFSLYQASSGGDHWNCPAHVNRFNKSTVAFRGYRATQSDGTVIEGDRAVPSLIFDDGAGRLMSVTPIQFWQNFPGKIACSDQDVELCFFPPMNGDCHEMQGGERKQHRIHFSFAGDLSQAKASAHKVPGGRPLRIDRRFFAAHDVLGQPVAEEPGRYEKLLVPSLSDVSGFFAKREAQDEYGWRHFGDVVADHETLYHEGDAYFISHYNNQYDCIHGFARQYLLSGDARWYRLMEELAQHVLDIDIYRTNEDRAEYNYGLFWHTDHYRSASTSTHRTYSRDHYPSDWTGAKGGGPGPEHCYTSGLTLYYYLSGNEDAKDTVLRLTEWITNYYEGTGTFIEYGKALVTHDVKKLLTALKGGRVLRYRYPINRGTGNYIRALLDSYELTEDSAYLQRATRAITDTYSALDDIGLRDFGDIEGTWHYTVFLQEVLRFLDLKRVTGQFDADFHRARNGLMHYARWMVDHEAPYLVQPDKLEYPNDTWVAQDIRKANVLYGAYRYTADDRAPLLKRACFFRDYVINELEQSDTLHYARLQALIMQNQGPACVMENECEPYEIPETTGQSVDRESEYKVRDFIRAVVSGFGRVIKTTSPRREYAWVRVRLGK